MRRALPFVARLGWGGGGGVRGRGGLKLLLTPRPDLNAGWGAGGRRARLFFQLESWVSLRAGNLEMGEGAEGPRREGPASLHSRAQVLRLGVFFSGPARVRTAPVACAPRICTPAQMWDALTECNKPKRKHLALQVH